MASIDINNGVVNAGGMPSIFAGTTPPTVGAYSIWLDTTTNSLNYWNGGGWTAIGSIPAIPNLEEVLEAGNTAVTPAIFKSQGVYAGDYPMSVLNQQSLFTSTYNGQQMTDGAGHFFVLSFIMNRSISDRPVLFMGNASHQMYIIPPDLSGDVTQNFVNANGNIYPGATGTVTLSSGTAVISDANVTAKSTVTFATKTGSGTLGVTYQGAIDPGVSIQVTALKTNNTTETSDNSILYYQIWHTN